MRSLLVDAASSGAARAPRLEELLDRRLLVDAGKTTVAAALGVTAAAAGRRTVVCELGRARRLRQAFGGSAVAGDAPAQLADDLWAPAIDSPEALAEWLARQPGGALAVAVLGRPRAFAQLLAAAPEAQELATIGRLVDLTDRATHAGNNHRFDPVVVDAPSTGHALAVPHAPRNFAALAAAGPIGQQDLVLRKHLEQGRQTGYVGVSLPEAPAVLEPLELERGMRETVGRDLDLIVVNAVYPDRFYEQLAQLLARQAG